MLAKGGQAGGESWGRVYIALWYCILWLAPGPDTGWCSHSWPRVLTQALGAVPYAIPTGPCVSFQRVQPGGLQLHTHPSAMHSSNNYNSVPCPGLASITEAVPGELAK